MPPSAPAKGGVFLSKDLSLDLDQTARMALRTTLAIMSRGTLAPSPRGIGCRRGDSPKSFHRDISQYSAPAQRTPERGAFLSKDLIGLDLDQAARMKSGATLVAMSQNDFLITISLA
jgi:hypothetical protein